MQIKKHELLADLLASTEAATNTVKQLKGLSTAQLNYKASENEWSILECIEHLNLYGDFYLPEIEKQILAQKKIFKAKVFRSGLIGNYFANLMKVSNGKIKKMKSPKDKNPNNSKLTIVTIDRFLKQQEMLKSLLQQARYVDLTKTKTAISLTPLIRLRLGDTFRFFVYHIERHVLQASNVPVEHCYSQLMEKVA